MSDQFIAEIRMFAGSFAPLGWAFCNGQTLPIAQNTALFSLIGTYYGGDGKTTFALPNLQGTVPIQQGQGLGLSARVIGESGGNQTVTLLQSEIPYHSHSLNYGEASVPLEAPANSLPTAPQGRRAPLAYITGLTSQNTVHLHASTVGAAGGSSPHNNMQPYLAVNFIIALQGDFPMRE
ncbi:microcystin-dependent protein [Paenibacillus cellulosilyticus]|uniref:Microcystin-dependent protein n=1 Tax=Paenibacillus cellulosilyticus TaxID=375489 RepID=A0A2V2YRT0_9BACL|nr:tail fiber protein [Paenibacillus cellulosilyticus]PWW00757.1 microcystin-dependent protein [Paenibacillus cellulosilyticus]QKS45612.1 phage tail protein [Paenibacillus cellulosilyticus]